MANTYPNCPGSLSHMLRAYPQALDSLAWSDHRSVGDVLNCGLGGYPKNHAVAPRMSNKLGPSVRDDSVGPIADTECTQCTTLHISSSCSRYARE
jgi:hypothetical protein